MQMKLEEAVVIDSFQGVKNPEKSFCEIRCNGSQLILQSVQFDLKTIPQLEKLNLLIDFTSRVYNGRDTVLYVENVKVDGSKSSEKSS